MANNEFKTAAAKLLEQNGVKETAAAVMQAEIQIAPPQSPAPNTTSYKTASPVARIPLTFPLVVSLAKTRLSLGLAVVCCALMWLVVPELLIPKSFKVFNAVLGIIIGLTYGVILTFPQSRGSVGVHREE